MKKKFVSIFMCVVVCSLSVIVPYYNVKATESALAIGGLSVGSALLGTLALCGVGMELDNNRQFNELSETEKERITNGLATNFNDVALQRGAALETIKNWTDNLSQGLLDKSSECWDIFKDWAKNIDIKGEADNTIQENGKTVSYDYLLGMTFTDYNNNTFTITQEMVDFMRRYGGTYEDNCIGFIVVNSNISSMFPTYMIYAITDNTDFDYVLNNYAYTISVNYNGRITSNGLNNTNTQVLTYDYFTKHCMFATASKPIYLRNSEGMIENNVNGFLYGTNESSIFKTNTEYLERLQGEKEGIIIDVTDIKNPIIEGQRNELTRIDFNRGSKRNNDDDNNKNELVFTPVTYEALDDYMIGQNNAITQYDNEITENPDEADKIFISTTPIVNINEFYNTLPVVDTPISNTVINNNYTYNNYTNNNVTLNDLPYNADLIPNIPTMIFENKFPFCIPYDMYTFLKVFYVEREAPTFTFDVPFPSENGLEVTQITLSLADFEYASLVLRVMWFLLFVFGLMLITRNLIKG